MDNNMQPFNPQPSGRPIDPELPPAMNEPTPAPNAEASQAPQASPQAFPPNPTETAPISNNPALHNTGVPLSSPILGPTHFDDMKNPDIKPQTVPTQAAQASTEQKAKMYMLLSIVFGAFAFVGIILGIWSLVANITTSNKLASADIALNNANAIIAKVEADTGVKITSPDNVPAYNPVIGNIYISEWGIKFKIPDDLENVSYILDQKYRPEICFTGNKIGIKYFPGFADIDKNTAGLGCVKRVATSEGDTDKDTGNSFGQKVYTYGEYNYFYTGPTVHFSQEPAEQGLEDTAVQIIKNMISSNISHYE